MTLLARTLPAALAATLLAAAPAGAVTFPANQRPHTRVATYTRNGITVDRLQATVRATASGLRVAVTARIHNDLHLVKGVVVRVARCTGTELAFPTCPTSAAFDIPVGPGRTVSLGRTATIPVPARFNDRIQVTVTRHAPLPRPALRGTYGELLLDGRAWRGAAAGTAFGLDLTPRDGTDVRRMIVDAAAETSTSLRAAVAWTAATAQATTLSTGLAGEALHPDTGIPAAGHASFLDRPSITAKGRPNVFTAVVRPATGDPLATVRLPWPT